MNQIINPTVTSQSQYLPTIANDKPKQSQSGSKRSLNAKRLINTKQLDYQAWLEVRKQGIGSSDAAAACGLNPYMSMLELWMIKTGRVQQNIDDESSGHAPLYWGKQLEPLVAEYYSMHTNNKVRRVNAVLQHPDPDKAFMWANVDYAVVGNEDVQILECKTAGEYGAKLWRDGVPLYVLCQVQHQLAVTGKQAAHKMQEAERATFKVGSVTWKKSKDSISLDSKALLKSHPEYLNQFPQTKQGSRRFNIYSKDD